MAEPLTLENFERAERDVYRLSGLSDECFEMRNVKVGEHEGEDINIRTVIVTLSKE